MKKKSIFLLTIVLLAAMSGCKKDEQPRYDKLTILKNTGEKIRQMEKYVDDNRSTGNPSSYDTLARYCTDQVIATLKNELKPDVFRSNRGEIALMIAAYDEYWRDKNPKRQSKVWKRLKIGIDDDTYRVCEAYSEALLKQSKSYIEGSVNGPATYISGYRVDWMEDNLRDLMTYADPNIVWPYQDRVFIYFKNFAQNPNNKAKFKRHGFMDWGWFD